jgi:hypothetical protein
VALKARGKVETDVLPYFKSVITDSFAVYPEARMLTVSDRRYSVLSVKPTVKLEVASVWLMDTVYVPVRLVFAGEEKSFQKFVLLLPTPAALVITWKFFRKETRADVVTFTSKVYVWFIPPLERLRVMFVSDPSCMRVGETDNEYVGAAEIGRIP